MSVELQKLYNEIHPHHNVRILTTSCFNKRIGWVHVIDNMDFIPLLHGDELIFNSSLNYETDAFRKSYIDKLLLHGAGGLIVALRQDNTISDELIEYCNQKQFPLFRANWETSYLIIMRRFSEILLSNERKEMNLITALKNAIYYPTNAELYVKHFARNDFAEEMPYVISIIENAPETDIPLLTSILQHTYEQCIIYEETNRLILLTTGYSPKHLKTSFSTLVQKHPFLQIGIGSLESNLLHLHLSFENATSALQLAGSVIPQNPLCYDEIGSYQILCNLKNPPVVCDTFVKQTLGKLIEYDVENHTSYMELLKDFFENECNITQTANATFFHPNTLKYKVKHIKEILGYDITSNENRTKIMLSLYMLALSDVEQNP